MVVSLNPGKFYGSSLPRPRLYTEVKFSDGRVDPPVSVLDPLMSWAEEAHWSMGGLSFNRLRLQGKIEGNVNKLKKEREVTWNKKTGNWTPESKTGPISKKRRQRKIVDDDEEEEEFEDEDEEIEVEMKKKVGKNGGLKKKNKRRRLVRKLGDDFELVGGDNMKSERSPSKDLSNGGDLRGFAARTRRSMLLLDEEEDADNDGAIMRKGKKIGGDNGKIEIINEKNVSRSSPRLKRKSN